jgi:flagellar motor switch protein FliN
MNMSDEMNTPQEEMPASDANASATATAEPATAGPTTAEAPLPALQPGEVQDQSEPGGQPLDMDFILDIPLNVRVEVGRKRVMIQDLLKYVKGSVIELDKLLGEPFEVLVNDKLMARGEVVVVNDRFGIRITDIISPNERVKSLG